MSVMGLEPKGRKRAMNNTLTCNRHSNNMCVLHIMCACTLIRLTVFLVHRMKLLNYLGVLLFKYLNDLSFRPDST